MPARTRVRSGPGRRHLLIGAASGTLVLGLLAIEAAVANFEVKACETAPSGIFDDVVPTDVHAADIDCIAAIGLTEGVAANRYDPAGVVTRGQMVSFLVNLAETALGHEFRFEPSDQVPVFDDVRGSVHAENIEIAHALGITSGLDEKIFGPTVPLTRAQASSLVARTIEGVIGGVFSDERLDAFGDDDGDFHEDSIDALAGAGIVRGVGSDHFQPAGLVRRDQLATFLAQSAGFLDSQGRWVGPLGGEPEPARSSEPQS